METTDKIIVIDNHEIAELKTLTLDEEGHISRDFYDWYLKESTFFVVKGTLIIPNLDFNENGQGLGAKQFIINFDFTNPGNPEFTIVQYKTEQVVCKFSFNREENLSMKDVKVKIDFIRMGYYILGGNGPLFSQAILDNMQFELKKRSREAKSLPKRSLKSLKSVTKPVYDKMAPEVAKYNCEFSIYSIYATMYHFSKTKAVTLINTEKKDLVEKIGIIESQVRKYKYTGYVNLEKATIYTAKKLKSDGPKKDFQRHIEKWSVRGHYRRVNGNLIWIDPFEKGQGTLEKRVYGNENTPPIDIEPKIFEVTKEVIVKQLNAPVEVERPIAKVVNVYEINNQKTDMPLISIGLFARVLNNVKAFFRF